MSQLGVGLIGCGGMGRALGTQLLQVEGAKLVGVADVSPEAVARASSELQAPGFDSAEALLANPEVQAVVIASPPFQHRPLTELAAARGKHIFVEKPMAANPEDCDRMMVAAANAGVTLMVGQVLRYYPCWYQILEMVRSGQIGNPMGITVTRIGGGWGGWSQPWRNSLEMSGGLLMEVNAHEIDFMCQVGGDVTRVYAEADHFAEGSEDYPNLYFVSLRFASGAVGLLHASTVSALNDLSGKIQGDQGTIIYTNGFSADGEIRYAKRDGTPESLRVGDIQAEQPVRKELRLFVESVVNGTPPPVPGPEGKRNVAIAMAAYESAKTGKAVDL